MEETTKKNVFKVFISSTYRDNVERRRLVQDAIAMAGMVWQGMELFTAQTHPTTKACLDAVREADLLVGIIAHRYGWEPDGKKSITEMEYDEAKEHEIDCLMFQVDSSIPVHPDQDYDTEGDRWDKQKKLEAFRKKFDGDQMPTTFKETTLQAKVLEALNRWKRQPEAGSEKPKQAKKPKKKQFLNLDKAIRGYKQKSDALHSSLPVAGFATQLKVPIDIEDIYVTLTAMLDLRGVGEGSFADALDAERCLKTHGDHLEIALPEAFQQAKNRNRQGLTILGDPGSGKTTHLKRLLLWTIRSGSEYLGLPKDLVPVFLPLRHLRSLDHGLEHFIQQELNHPHLNTPKNFGENLLERGHLLLLFDGLDEVADLSQREKVAQWIVDAISIHSTCRFVVSCRFAGYSPTVRLSEKFLEMHIRPFSTEQAEEFIRKWYRIVELGLAKDTQQAESIANTKAEKLIQRLKEPDFRAQRIFELTRNPLLLANICLVHRHRNVLPKKRVQLYEECIKVLLESWRQAKDLPIEISAEEGRRALQPAAYWMHEVVGRTRATSNEFEPHIAPALKKIGWTKGTADDFLRIIRDESGLLTGWDQDYYGFMHLGFQEYLAAREIRNQAYDHPEVLKELASHFGESWWQEVTLLLLGLEEPSLFTPCIREIMKLGNFTEFPNLMEACLEDAAEVSGEAFEEILKMDPGSDQELWKRQTAALRILERMAPSKVDSLTPVLKKHPFPEVRIFLKRRGRELQQEIFTADPGGYELVRIPSGEFRMGSPNSEEGHMDWEEPVHKVSIPEFYMGRYPVTNKEYSEFLKQTRGAPEPKYWADRRYNQENQPVVGVSWEDAQKYAGWAGLRLPTEAEWEYVCRAGTTTRFYNGNEDKNLDQAGWYSKNSQGQLWPVGEKEPNAFGLYDMHGNVWEWVEDDWHNNYKNAPNGGRAWINEPRGSFRVIRGGSWDYDADFCRSAMRRSVSPGNRWDVIGFRLSRSVSP